MGKPLESPDEGTKTLRMAGSTLRAGLVCLEWGDRVSRGPSGAAARAV